MFGETAVKITAPGDRTRDSVRVHFTDRTMIASRRSNSGRLKREIAFLSRMAGTDAPVPELLGVEDGILFQSDIGTTRLTAEMSRRTGQDREALAAEAFESLWRIKEHVQSSGFMKDVQPIATAEL